MVLVNFTLSPSHIIWSAPAITCVPATRINLVSTQPPEV